MPTTTLATRPDPATDPRLNGPRRLPLGRPEQLSGLRRRETIRLTADGALHPADWEIGPWTRGLDGRPTGAAACVAVDNLTAVTLHWAAENAMTAVVTTQLQINVLRTLPAFDPADPTDRPRLAMLGVPLMHDSLGGAARGLLVDDAGTPYVEATGWFQAVDGIQSAGREAYIEQAAQPIAEADQDSMAAVTALVPESVPAPRSGERPAVTEDAVEGLRFRHEPALDNPGAMTHGGIQTMRAVLAAQAALSDRQEYDVQAVQVVFARPGLGEQVALTRVRHAGRSLRIVEVELVGVDPETGVPIAGRPAIQAQVSFRAAQR